MKNSRPLLAAIALAGLFIQSCSTGEAPLLLPPPSMVPYVDDPFAETGIRATPNAVVADSGGAGGETEGGILVEWHAIDPTRVLGVRIGGYYIYRSENRTDGEPKSFSRYRRIPLSPAGDDTLFIDEAIQQGFIYSYYVTSYNRSDESQESSPSDTVQFIPTTRPVLTVPRGEIEMPQGEIVDFFFEPRDQIGGYVAVEVNEVDPLNERVLIRRVWRSDSVYVSFGSGSMEYGGDIPLERGRRYRWRIIKHFPKVDAASIPRGNTSKWEAFSIKP